MHFFSYINVTQNVFSISHASVLLGSELCVYRPAATCVCVWGTFGIRALRIPTCCHLCLRVGYIWDQSFVYTDLLPLVFARGVHLGSELCVYRPAATCVCPWGTFLIRALRIPTCCHLCLRVGYIWDQSFAYTDLLPLVFARGVHLGSELCVYRPAATCVCAWGTFGIRAVRIPTCCHLCLRVGYIWDQSFAYTVLLPFVFARGVHLGSELCVYQPVATYVCAWGTFGIRALRIPTCCHLCLRVGYIWDQSCVYTDLLPLVFARGVFDG